MILNDAKLGSMGLIYWFERTEYQVPEEEVSKIRQKAISNMIYGAIQTAAYSGANQSMDVQTAMQRGWNEGNKQVEMMENGTEMRNEMFLIGDPNTISRIEQIEQSKNFRGWSNPHLIEMIKNTNNE
jgi:hypothetical protein